MGMGNAAKVGPYIAVVQRLQNALAVRADILLAWRDTEEGLMADIAEGKLLLTTYSEFWKLTVILEVESSAEADMVMPRKIVWGYRPITVGSVGRLQRIALDLALGGVPGGPTITEDTTWKAVHGSQRRALPTGELRISDLADGPSTLTFEDGTGVELLGKGPRQELERQALIRWEKRPAKPLQLVLQGHTVKLRSIGVAGVIGYHVMADASIVALVQEGNDLALVHIDGLYPYLIARVSWDEALTSGCFDVDALLEAQGAANTGPSANEAHVHPEVRLSHTLATVGPMPPVIQASLDAGIEPHVELTSMSEHNRALCRWYLQWLHGRLRGRGARKARALVLLILAAIERCRADITGTRIQVHTELARVLGMPELPGGERNIRDCLDLLAAQSLLVVRADGGTRCTLLLGQLHDPDSALMRGIAAMKAAQDGAATAAAPGAPQTVETARVNFPASEVPIPRQEHPEGDAVDLTVAPTAARAPEMSEVAHAPMTAASSPPIDPNTTAPVHTVAVQSPPSVTEVEHAAIISMSAREPDSAPRVEPDAPAAVWAMLANSKKPSSSPTPEASPDDSRQVPDKHILTPSSPNVSLREFFRRYGPATPAPGDRQNGGRE